MSNNNTNVKTITRWLTEEFRNLGSFELHPIIVLLDAEFPTNKAKINWIRKPRRALNNQSVYQLLQLGMHEEVEQYAEQLFRQKRLKHAPISVKPQKIDSRLKTLISILNKKIKTRSEQQHLIELFGESADLDAIKAELLRTTLSAPTFF